MNLQNDRRIVMTLDAGGTSFVFSAIRGSEEIISPITLSAHPADLDGCLQAVVEGFSTVQKQLPEKAAAVSFAFPGPADYPRGIIGDLPNFPAFRGGVALGPMLEERFKLPVFINNDGDLFTYGEAIAGFLPLVNGLLQKAGSPKRYQNLVGVTLGTGFGCGISRNGEMHLGDNAVGAEIWLLRNIETHNAYAEENVGIRAVQRFYAEKTGMPPETVPSPADLYHVSKGKMPGDRDAAVFAFEKMGTAVGDALAQAATLVDGLLVIGGGIAGAADLFLPAVVAEMNRTYQNRYYPPVRRLIPHVFNLENEQEKALFLKGQKKEIQVPGTAKIVVYDALKRTAVGLSRLGTSRAIFTGAYAFALSQLDKSKHIANDSESS